MDDEALSQYGERIISVFELLYRSRSAGERDVQRRHCVLPDDAPDMDALVSNADTAMYRAKGSWGRTAACALTRR